MRLEKNFCLFIGSCIILCGVFGSQVTAGETFAIDRFIAPDTCAGCHGTMMEEWTNSMHHLSHSDPLYLAVARMLRKGLTDKEEIKEAESCVKCHTPLGFVSGFPKKFSDDLSKTDEISAQGIQCDFCHSAVKIKQMYNNGMVLSPGHGEDDPGIKYGPFDDCEPEFHEAEFSKLHTQSAICGTCHNVKHVVFGTDLETTYTEWENSPYNSHDPAKRVTCQGCHMYQRPGVPATGSTPRPENPGAATDFSEERPHIFTHYFVGANTVIPKLQGDEQKVEMARARLANAATIMIKREPSEPKTVVVDVSNTGAGHSIPTGLGDLRQVWIELIHKGKDDQVKYASGILDKKQVLPEDAVVFRTVFAGKDNQPVLNIAKARSVLADNRIKAGQTVTIRFSLSMAPEKGDVVSARLLYRSIPTRVLNMLPESDRFDPAPVIEMAAAKQMY